MTIRTLNKTLYEEYTSTDTIHGILLSNFLLLSLFFVLKVFFTCLVKRPYFTQECRFIKNLDASYFVPLNLLSYLYIILKVHNFDLELTTSNQTTVLQWLSTYVSHGLKLLYCMF